MSSPRRIRDYGDRALLLECGSTDEVLAASAAIRDARLSGVLDIVPAARTVLVTLAQPAQQAAARQRLAGLAGFIVGQTINAWTVVKIKERTRERHLWARLVGSTFAGQLGDTLVFCSIAAGAIGITSFGDFATYTALGWVYKTAVEVVMLPITYRVIAYIKRHEPTYTALV